MDKEQFTAMGIDLKNNPTKLAEYRKTFRNVYPFSDGVFKKLLVNEYNPERAIKFLNAMLGLKGKNAIKTFTFGTPEQPGILEQKSTVFDIYGHTQAGEPVLIEVQQSHNALFEDRLIYYTSRVISNTVKKSKKYNLPHIYVLSLLTENQFALEKDTYFHHAQIIRNREHVYPKLDIYFVEMKKFIAIEDRTPTTARENSPRADILRLFRAVIEDKNVEKLQGVLDNRFAKDVSLESYSDEVLFNGKFKKSF